MGPDMDLSQSEIEVAVRLKLPPILGYLIAGVVMLAWPGLSLLTLLMVVGWYLVFIGVFEIVMAFVIRKQTKALTS